MPATVFIEGNALGGPGWEPQRKNHWKLVFPGAPPVLGKELALTLYRFKFPTTVVSVDTIPIGNSFYRFPIAPEPQEFALTLTDYVEQAVSMAFWQWNQEVYSQTTLNVGTEFKQDGELSLYTVDGEDSRAWLLRDMWPSKVDMGDGDMDDSSLNRIVVTFQCGSIVTYTASVGQWPAWNPLVG